MTSDQADTSQNMFLNTVFQCKQVTIFTLVTALSTLWMIVQNYDEFSSLEIKIFALYTAAIFTFQLLIMGSFLLLRRFFNRAEAISSLAAGIFTTFNVLTLLLFHDTAINKLEGFMFGGFITIIFVVCSLLFFARNKNFVKFSHVFLLIMLVTTAVQLLEKGHFSVKGIFDRIPKHFEYVEFKKKPNIYLVSFDALAPANVLKENLGISTVEYIDELKNHGARIIKNSFAERIPTKRSLNIILAMDKNYFDTVSEDAGFVRDQVPNPVYELFRRNDYKIQFMYSNRYFGDDEGKLDYYGIAQSYGVCKHIEKDYSFMGYCSESVQEAIKTVAGIQQLEYPKMLFDRIQKTAGSEEAWFTYASIYEPGHAKNSTQYNNKEDLEEYRQHFKKKAPKAAETLSELLSIIKNHDPDSITIVFGDHGSLVSIGALDDYRRGEADAASREKNSLQEDSLLNFKQVVRDRHAVVVGIMPATACNDNFVQNPYSTLRIIRDLAICLSGEDPLPANMQSNDNRWSPYKYE